MNGVIYSYKDLIVWKKSMDLVVNVYKLTDKYPSSERYILSADARKTSISIPSNIAEGRMRGSRKDYCRFLLIAYASCGELETQIELGRRLEFCNNNEFEKINELLIEIMKMLNVMIGKLRN